MAAEETVIPVQLERDHRSALCVPTLCHPNSRLLPFHVSENGSSDPGLNLLASDTSAFQVNLVKERQAS